MIAQELGYVGFAADMYGVFTQVPATNFFNPQSEYQIFLRQYTSNQTFFAKRIRAAVDFVKTLDVVDSKRVALVGYCFGGTGVIQYLNVGENGASAGAVSIHPSLPPGTPGLAANITPPVLVLTGGKDFLTSPMSMIALEGNLNGAQATWETTRYAGVNHAWTNWFNPSYDEAADSRSWQSMASFLDSQFSETDYNNEPPTAISVQGVTYTDKSDNNFSFQGYLSVPEDVCKENPAPAVVIIHDMDGPTLYEKQRATHIADETGYITFVADIFGSDAMKNTENAFESKAQLYLENKELFVSRIQAAIDFIRSHELVDSDNISLVGFSFGGTGSIYYSLIGNTSEVKSIVSFHASLDSGLPEAKTINPEVQILILSGGEGDDITDINFLESVYIAQNAQYEISRFSNAQGGFTVWNSTNYNVRASTRSFDSMQMIFEEVFNTTETPKKPCLSKNVTGEEPESGVVTPFTGGFSLSLIGLSVVISNIFF